MKRVEVRLTRGPTQERVIGTLAESERRIYFEWDASFVAHGIELSPFKLPLHAGLLEHRDRGFGPLPGLFAESLPDGWGLLLMDRHFRRAGLDFASISPLDRLAYLGTRTMGALTYHPPTGDEAEAAPVDLYELGQHAQDVFAGTAVEVLPELERAGGSPGGARPKGLVGVRGEEVVVGDGELPTGFEPWIVKFAAREDAADAGPVEYAYALMAEAAGVSMPQTRLFEVGRARRRRRYFGVRRFDRGEDGRRFHIQSLANLIHLDFRIPNTDYTDLLEVTRALTRNEKDVLRAFRQMVFNVATHVRDDHTNNFTFILDEHEEWTLSPAYDLTFADGPGGEHSMTVAGEGRAPDRSHCLAVGNAVGVTSTRADEAFAAVGEAVARWDEFAQRAKCPRATARRIGKRLRSV